MADDNLPHVLVVDDDPAIRELLTGYLGENDIRVTATSSGKEMNVALEMFAIDLVILDLRMPGEDGVQIARALREQSNLPIMIVSGKRDEADRVMALELGADDYLTKPFSSRELLARVRALLRRASAMAPSVGRTTDARAYRFAGWELNIGTRKLTDPAGTAVELTNGEFCLRRGMCCPETSFWNRAGSTMTFMTVRSTSRFCVCGERSSPTPRIPRSSARSAVQATCLVFP